LQYQQCCRLSQSLLLARQLTLELCVLVLEIARFAGACCGRLVLRAKGGLPAIEVMGENAMFAAPCLQGFARQAVRFLQGRKLLARSPVLWALLSRRLRTALGDRFFAHPIS
jgi:hypothetical protein